MSLAVEYSIAETLVFEESLFKKNRKFVEALTLAREMPKKEALQKIVNTLKLILARSRPDLSVDDIDDAFECDKVKTVIFLYYTREFENEH
jgi:hypothetical protein